MKLIEERVQEALLGFRIWLFQHSESAMRIHRWRINQKNKKLLKENKGYIYLPYIMVNSNSPLITNSKFLNKDVKIDETELEKHILKNYKIINSKAMKKFILSMLLLMSVAMGAFAQKAVETSRFTDNVSVTLQGGIVTPFGDFFKNGSTTPVIVLGVDKYINPWLGVGIEGRTTIGTGSGNLYNPHTAFDAVNVSGYVKFNVLNILKGYKGDTRTFEPVVYTGIGWGHTNCSDANVNQNYVTVGQVGMTQGVHLTGSARNYMTYRAGVELNFNLGSEKAWAVVVNPSVVWGDVCNGRLNKQNANFEVTAGVKYRFKNANGTRNFKVYDIAAINEEINSLRAENEALKNVKPTVITNTVTEIKTVENGIVAVVQFAQNDDELTNEAKTILESVKADKVTVVAYASPEGSKDYNQSLSEHRAANVADYLAKLGKTVVTVRGAGAANDQSNRIAIVSVAE